MTLQPLQKTKTCHTVVDAGDVRENTLSNITPLALSGILNAMGTEVSSMRVCRSLNLFFTDHVKKASTNATGRLTLFFPDGDRFTRLDMINIHGSPIHSPLIPRYCHLRQLIWNNCTDLQDYDLMQISQSKNLEQIYLKNSYKITCLGLLILLNEFPKLANLKIQVPNLDDFSSLDREKTKKALALRSLDIEIHQVDHRVRYDENYAFKDKANFLQLLDKIPCLREFTLYKLSVDIDLIKKILIELRDLECFRNRERLYHLRDDIKYSASNLIDRPFKLENITLNELEDNYDDDIEDSDDIANDLLVNLISNSPMLRKLSLKETHAYCIDYSSQNPLIGLLYNIKYLKAGIKQVESIEYMLKRFEFLTVLKLNLANLDYENGLKSCFCSENKLIHLKLFNCRREISFESIVELARSSPALSSLSLKGKGFDVALIENEDEIIEPEDAFKSLRNFKINFPMKKGLFAKMMSKMPELSKLAIRGENDANDLFQGFQHLKSLQKLTIDFLNLDNLLSTSSPNLLNLRSLRIKGIYCKVSVIADLAKAAPNLKALRIKINRELSLDFCTTINQELRNLEKIKVVSKYNTCSYEQILMLFCQRYSFENHYLKPRKLVLASKETGIKLKRYLQSRFNDKSNINLARLMNYYKQEVYIE